MKALSLKIPEELAERLDAYARNRGKSKSAVLREFIEQTLDAADANPLADIAHIIGAVRGPADLSTNKDYLEGLGGK